MTSSSVASSLMAILTVPFIWIIPISLLSYKIITFSRREKGLPPGPPTVPVLGNAHLIPSKGFYAKLKHWADEYGSVYSLKVGRSTMVVLNDRKAIHELLNQQGAFFNDRPRDQHVEACMREENPAMMHEGLMWKAERKLVTTYFSPKNLDTSLKAVQEAEICQLMSDLLEKPAEFRTSVKRTTASIGTITLYGHRAPTFESFWGSAVYVAMDASSKALEPGTYLPVDQFPFLKLIPDRWNGSRRRADKSYRGMTDIWNEARERVEDRRSKGDTRESLIDRLLSEDVKSDVPLSYTAFNNFFGGTQMGAADTTATQVLTTILFLAKHPEVQEKARLEVDRVCGTERLPEWSDFDKLPYINCIVKEGLRIRPVVPTGVPHCAKQDTWYDGMFIPAGSTIFIPPSALNHDNNYSEDPSTYNPDRYLSQASKLAPELAASPLYEERDHYTYGVGRRMCPGIYLAERTQWRITAQMLWAFKIERQGELDTGYEMYEEGFLHSTKDFKVKFVSRSREHANVVRKMSEQAEQFLKKWE